MTYEQKLVANLQYSTNCCMWPAHDGGAPHAVANPLPAGRAWVLSPFSRTAIGMPAAPDARWSGWRAALLWALQVQNSELLWGERGDSGGWGLKARETRSKHSMYWAAWRARRTEKESSVCAARRTARASSRSHLARRPRRAQRPGAWARDGIEAAQHT